MKTTVLILVILVTTLSFSQTRNIKVNVNYKVSAEGILVSLNSQVENLTNCSIQVLDSMKKIVQTLVFPKPVGKQMMKQYTETSIPIKDLPSGGYTWVAYLGKEEMYRRNFSTK